jgi:hypothetical protein
MPYSIPTSGPTSSYPGDPTDYSGGTTTNAFSYVDSVFDNLGGILGGIGSVVNAAQGNPSQPGVYYPGQQYSPYGPYAPTTPTQSNTGLYIGGAVIILLLVLGAIFLIAKK